MQERRVPKALTTWRTLIEAVMQTTDERTLARWLAYELNHQNRAGIVRRLTNRLNRVRKDNANSSLR